MTTLKGRTLFITGGSRGIGKAIALRAAREGAQVTIAAKTTKPHPKLPGTIYTAAEEIEAAGGKALACAVDIRSEDQVKAAVDATVAKFGGIDILVNNASAISLSGTLETQAKRFDLMHQINSRGTFLCSQICIPHLLESSNPHVLNLAPPLDMNARWFARHAAYTMAKYGMSMCVLGMAEEFKGRIAFNALWPRTLIDTAAVRNLLGGDAAARRGRKPAIVADAAHGILTRDAQNFSGNFLIDDAFLRSQGVTDLRSYQVDPELPEDQLQVDLFL